MPSTLPSPTLYAANFSLRARAGGGGKKAKAAKLKQVSVFRKPVVYPRLFSAVLCSPQALLRRLVKIDIAVGDDGRYGMLVDQLLLVVYIQQDGKIIETAHCSLNLVAVNQENSEHHVLFPGYVQKIVLQVS